VIDIGSNSIRLVVYRLEGRAIWTVYNEKALAGLGRDLQSTGRLSPEGVEVAMSALRRFRVLLQGWSSRETYVVATAAVREARDSRAFLRAVEEETGITVRVLSGEEEARYGALGVLAGQADAGGVAGDLGGSSLELVRLDDPEQGVSLPRPLGPGRAPGDGCGPGAAGDRPGPAAPCRAPVHPRVPRRGRRLA
jgi:exopolyphosphatase/guanosine-5'-triphosphate,3'-diphosphate pyrophosphatase